MELTQAPVVASMQMNVAVKNESSLNGPNDIACGISDDLDDIQS